VREADHSPPSNAEVKNGGAILPILVLEHSKSVCAEDCVPAFVGLFLLIFIEITNIEALT
jgi:hypothetical protein